MNSKTHKVLTATYYPREVMYAIPMDWDLKDVYISRDQLYYKGEPKDVPYVEVDEDNRRPDKITEKEYDVDQFFDCEEEDEESEEEPEQEDSKPKMDEQEASQTHKAITATYITEVVYAVPKDWAMQDIAVKWGNMYYKGELTQDVPKCELEPDGHYPADLEEDKNYNVEDLFEDLCVSHPPYYCDGGCGKKMGDQDDCQRICDDCGSDTSSTSSDTSSKKKKKKLVIVNDL